jgi:thiol-disulfide isomerase/thioredoxin
VVAIATIANTAGGGGKDKPKFKDIKIDGVLARNDDKDPRRGTPCKIHVVALTAGQSYTIDMIGRGFDAYLRLEDKAGKELAEDDDSGGDLNAQIVFNCTKDDDYRIFCTSMGNGSGKYTLTVKAAGALVVNAWHARLFGMQAPDFEGDFALNGKAINLSDLKGKVVLLDFWAVQSSSSALALPRLREWHKAYKDAGLEVVGVTYFNSDLGHKLGFDPSAGQVINIAAASPATDRELFKAFAAHHKVDHLLLALRKEKALKTFNDYLVNGLPQLVLIDRQGVVRFACVGSAQIRNPDVDVEIKKLLAEKK